MVRADHYWEAETAVDIAFVELASTIELVTLGQVEAAPVSTGIAWWLAEAEHRSLRRWERQWSLLERSTAAAARQDPVENREQSRGRAFRESLKKKSTCQRIHVVNQTKLFVRLVKRFKRTSW